MRRLAAMVLLSLLLALGVDCFAAGLNCPKIFYMSEDIGNFVCAYSAENTTYVSLRGMAALLGLEGGLSWAAPRAVLDAPHLSLSAKPGDLYILANDRALPIPHGVQVRENRISLPIRVLAQALGLSLRWAAETNSIYLEKTKEPLSSGSEFYRADALYWLSRAISAESCGEPLLGKIAVGNVILNRTHNPQFPDTIYGVIFDERFGGQFEPVQNGTIYSSPTEESVLAAKLCLEGLHAAGESLYFLNPDKASNFWIMENRTFLQTIGSHAFYL